MLELSVLSLVIYIMYAVSSRFLNKNYMLTKFDMVQKKESKENKKLKNHITVKFLLNKKKLSFVLENQKITLFLDEYNTGGHSFRSDDSSYSVSFDKTLRQEGIYFVTLMDKNGSLFNGIGSLNKPLPNKQLNL